MSRAQLYLSPRPAFTGASSSYDKSNFVFFGVPYDRSSTYKAGSRFGPGAIRDVSANLELYSVRSDIDLEKIPVHDMGDIDTVEDTHETLKRITSVWSELVSGNKIPIMAGGEHTITKAAVDALSSDLGLVSFDAHLDLRDEFLGEKLMHATFMRRVAERIGPSHIMEVGIRAFSKPELDYCKKSGVEVITPQDIRRSALDKTAQRIRTFLSKFSHGYVTVDIDVLDPAFAPGVGNPEPDGLSTDELLTLVQASMGKNIIGLDAVEVSPERDSGQTAAVCAKVIFEEMASLSARGPQK
ncbi:MAG TPA: agmatinase [Candidatus Dormibacteraeota bacterium]|nr:agmatinase [Candidatus Dormibacteraeota bacterium]